MSEDGTSFTIDLPVTGQSAVDAAAASVDTLAVRLGDTSKAAVASSGAIKAAEASYRQAEQSADRAAKALERIGISADAQRGKLKTAMDAGDDKATERAAAKLQALTQRQAEAATKATALKSALVAEAAALDKLKSSAELAEKASRKGEGINFEGLSRGLGKLGGPLAEAGRSVAELGAGFGKLSKSIGAAGPYVAVAVLVVALAAALLAAAAAAAIATLKIAEWAVGLADADRSASLLAQGIARSVAGGEILDDKLTSLTKTLPLTRDELSGMAQKLADAGLRGKALAAALETTATKAAKLKFGPEFARQMLSLGEQSKVFKANIASVFGGLKIDGLLEALQKLIGMFDADSASGKALKVVFESLFQPLIDWITRSEPKIEGFFLQLEIWALKALIAIKPYGFTILQVGEAFLVAGAFIVGVFVVAILALVAVMALPLIAFAAFVYGLLWVQNKAEGWGLAIKAFFQGFSLADVGGSMIDGLVQGIEKGGAAVLAAMKGAVMGAVDGVKNLLGIHSPSKVFAEIGMQTGAGMSQGVERSSGSVQNSLESMVQPPSASAGTAATPSQANASNGGSQLSNVSFTFNGVEGADDAEGKFRELLIRLLEGNVTQLGAAVPNA